jgi:hypothetical protein
VCAFVGSYLGLEGRSSCVGQYQKVSINVHVPAPLEMLLFFPPHASVCIEIPPHASVCIEG